MNANKPSQIDLAQAFNTVTSVLKEHQASLNAADSINHNHGDNMVNNFQVITQAVRQSADRPPAEQLAQASQRLNQQTQSGSGQLYAQGLERAAAQVRGKQALTGQDAIALVQALMGGQPGAQSQPPGQQASSGGDPLDGFIGSHQNQPGGIGDTGSVGATGSSGDTGSGGASGGGGTDLLAGVLGSLMGGQQAAPTGSSGPANSGIDINTLMHAGMAFYQARQQGAAPAQALVQAVMAGSQMMNRPHQTQSGQLVAGTLMNVLGQMMSKPR